ncbi:MAG: S8 family serine peptidase, partial [Bacilli bacterium]|nr:S8 family serine peptidase [Bacilli bacterium]
MKKLGLLLCATSTLILAACSTAASQLKDLPERNQRIIVEVDRDIDTLNEEGAKKTQRAVYNNIKETATSNIRMIDSYSVLNNAFVLEVNSNDVESIKSVPGVKSVTVDKIHWERAINDDSYVVLDGDNPTDAIDESKNISAETMKMPEDNNEGEGTVVAILDNEFHFRGKLNATTPEWHHEVFNPLPDDVAVRFTFDTIKSATGLNAKARNKIKKAGEEGSEYFNSKVPFYFDYGGTSKIYGKRGTTQYDVHSELSYHGSHVSSITAANAPDYKGIAPKAQLVLMKVFTDYDAKGIGE